MSETPSSSRRLNGIALILLIVVIAIVVFAVRGRNKTEDNLGNPPSDSDVAMIDAAKSTVSYQGVDGTTAYDILKEKYAVVADETAYGPMVKSINGEEATDTTFWSFKVNGELAQVGAHQYTTKSTDTITWELTAIEQ